MKKMTMPPIAAPVNQQAAPPIIAPPVQAPPSVPIAQPSVGTAFRNTVTPRNARSNAANKLPRRARHTKPRGM